MIKLELSTEIYSDRNILEAKKAYDEYANIKIKSKKNNTIIIFSECKYDEMLTVLEFENYLIGLENV